MTTVALYSEPAGSMVCMFEGQHGGVTQVMFSPDGTKLYSGGRKVNCNTCIIVLFAPILRAGAFRFALVSLSVHAIEMAFVGYRENR